MGLRQFWPHILTLQEQANTVRSCEFTGISQELGQGGQGAGGHHVKCLGRQVFQAGILDGHGNGHPFGREAQKDAFLGGRLMQGDGKTGQHRCQDQAGKTGPGTQIRQGAGRLGDEGGELGAIPEMPPP